jgi:PhzF family phenazine biosynthesis protein
MAVSIVQVDAFTDRPFAGNPAAVCILPEFLPDRWLQDVAREMNLSETAFLVRHGDAFRLRWFTPSVEVDLCGHATLASAHVLWEEGHLARDRQARFLTRSGLLTAQRDGQWIELDFPATPVAAVDPLAGLPEALGISPTFIGKSRFDYLIELASEADLRDMQPNFAALAREPGRGFILTSRAAAPPYDFVSRFFAPSVGIDEDPVTGSAHGCLGPYWQEHLGKDRFLAFQASARTGVVRVQVAGPRVLLGGQAVVTLRGELTC